MSFRSRLMNVGKSISDFAINKVGHTAGKVINTGLKPVNAKNINTAAGAINNAIEGTQKAVGKVKDGTFANKVTETVGSINRNIWTNDNAYPLASRNGNVAIGGGFQIGDDLNRRAKGIVNKGAAIYDGMLNGPVKLLKKDENSLIGLKATPMGALLAGGAMIAGGVPDAGKQFIQNRQGYNTDTRPTTSAPYTPAYANNGGATGDLVFALNNLRHGGMM